MQDSLPAGAVIEDVQLTLTVSQVRETAPRSFLLHRVLTRWGEGLSDAGTGGASHGGGGGVQATPGDATWTWAVMDTSSWAAVGGDFVPAPSADSQVTGLGTAVWTSTDELVADVQGWVDDPSGNFGWILLGDESAPGTAKRFDSRENLDAAARPRLRVVYRLPDAVP